MSTFSLDGKMALGGLSLALAWCITVVSAVQFGVSWQLAVSKQLGVSEQLDVSWWAYAGNLVYHGSLVCPANSMV